MFIPGLNQDNNDAGKTFSIFWYPINLIFYALLYYSIFLLNNDYLALIIGIVCSSILLGIFQGVMINRFLPILIRWIILVPIAIISGLLWTGIFLGTLIVGMLFATTSLGEFYQLAFVVVPVSYGIIFYFSTYWVWHHIIVPIENSSYLSPKNKILFVGFIFIAGSVYLCANLNFAILVMTANNLQIGAFFSGLLFTFIAKSGVKEMMFENMLAKTF